MTHLQINAPGVIHEAIDGEVVIVNVDKGLYFSSDGVGAKLWSLIAEGESVESLIKWTGETYNAPSDDIEAFVSQLTENELVTPVDIAPTVEPAAAPSPTPASYTKPELNVYSDMEELLLLDPIHDATEEGWPNTPDASKSQPAG